MLKPVNAFSYFSILLCYLMSFSAQAGERPSDELHLEAAARFGETVMGKQRPLAIFDANGDGLADVLVQHEKDGAIAITTQDESGGWRVTTLVGIEHIDYAMPVDLNRDSHMDLAVIKNAGLHLLLNDGAGQFRDETAGSLELSDSFPGVTVSVSAGDVNGDGWIDLYESRIMEAGHGSATGGGANRLWLGQGTDEGDPVPRFREVAFITGVAGCCDSNDALIVDLDNDGDQDLLVLTRSGPVELFENNGIDGFVTRSGLPDGNIGWETINAGDFDNDGMLDLVLARTLVSTSQADPAASLLLRNEGNLRFNDVTSSSAFPALGNARLNDMNNDGKLDAVGLANGAKNRPVLNVFLQRDSGQFGTANAVSGSLDTISALNGLVADVNADGYQDLVVQNSDGLLRLWLNPPGKNLWLGFRFRGYENASIADTFATLYRKDGSSISRKLWYSSDRTDSLVIGMGRLSQIDLVAVSWPSGAVARFESRGLRQYISVVQPDPAKITGDVRIPGKVTRKSFAPRQCQ